MAWDASFKNLLKLFLTEGEVITEFDVPTANLRIDFLLKGVPNISPFNLGTNQIIGEFKSEKDRLSIEEFHKVIGKAYIYLSSTGNDWKELSIFIFYCRDTLPKKIVKSYQTNEVDKGILQIQHSLPIYIVLLNKIEYNSSNYFLALFAKKKIRRQAMVRAIREEQKFITSYAYLLYRDEVIEVSKSENIDPTTLSLGQLIERFGFKEFIEDVGFSKIVEEFGMSRVIEEVGIPRVIEEFGIPRVIEEVGIPRVIEEVGIPRVIEEVGISKVLAELTEKQKNELRELLKES